MIEVPLQGSGMTTPNEKSWEDVSVATYPNPVDDKLSLEFRTAVPGAVGCFDLHARGLRIYSTALESGT